MVMLFHSRLFAPRQVFSEDFFHARNSGIALASPSGNVILTTTHNTSGDTSMKLLAGCLVAALSFGLVGCSSDHSSLTAPSPVSPPVVSAPGDIPASGTWEINRMVYSNDTKEFYSIEGTISYEYSYNDAEFTFSTVTKIDVIPMSGKSETAAIHQDGEYVGSVSKNQGSIVRENYRLDTITPGSTLKVEFGLGELAQLQDMQLLIIVSGQDKPVSMN